MWARIIIRYEIYSLVVLIDYDRKNDILRRYDIFFRDKQCVEDDSNETLKLRRSLPGIDDKYWGWY